jgi:hypothetical protein
MLSCRRLVSVQKRAEAITITLVWEVFFLSWLESSNGTEFQATCSHKNFFKSCGFLRLI